jgi:hypothetical protein
MMKPFRQWILLLVVLAVTGPLMPLAAGDGVAYSIVFTEGALKATNDFDGRFLARVSISVTTNTANGPIHKDLATLRGSTISDQFWFASVAVSNSLNSLSGGITNVLRSLQISHSIVPGKTLPELIVLLSSAFSNKWPIIQKGTYDFRSFLTGDTNPLSRLLLANGNSVPTLNSIADSGNQPAFKPAWVYPGRLQNEGPDYAAGLAIHPADWLQFSTNLPTAPVWTGTTFYSGTVTIVRPQPPTAPGNVRIEN